MAQPRIVALDAGLGGANAFQATADPARSLAEVSDVSNGMDYAFAPSNPCLAVRLRGPEAIRGHLPPVMRPGGIGLTPLGAGRVHPASSRPEPRDGTRLMTVSSWQLPRTLPSTRSRASDRSATSCRTSRRRMPCAARAARFPAAVGFAKPSAVRDQVFPDSRTDQAVVGVRARWLLFEGARAGRIAEAEAAAREAAFAEDSARRRLEAETVATEALGATRLEVRAGVKPQLALLNAEREALKAAVGQTHAGRFLLPHGA